MNVSEQNKTDEEQKQKGRYGCGEWRHLIQHEIRNSRPDAGPFMGWHASPSALQVNRGTGSLIETRYKLFGASCVRSECTPGSHFAFLGQGGVVGRKAGGPWRSWLKRGSRSLRCSLPAQKPHSGWCAWLNLINPGRYLAEKGRQTSDAAWEDQGVRESPGRLEGSWHCCRGARPVQKGRKGSRKEGPIKRRVLHGALKAPRARISDRYQTHLKRQSCQSRRKNRIKVIATSRDSGWFPSQTPPHAQAGWLAHTGGFFRWQLEDKVGGGNGKKKTRCTLETRWQSLSAPREEPHTTITIQAKIRTQHKQNRENFRRKRLLGLTYTDDLPRIN